MTKIVKYTPEQRKTLLLQAITSQFAGEAISKIAVDLGVSRLTLTSWLQTEEAKQMKDELFTEIRKSAIAQVQHQVLQGMPKALSKLENLIDDKDFQAIKLWLTMAGLVGQEDNQQKQAQTITVVLPGKKEAKEV